MGGRVLRFGAAIIVLAGMAAPVVPGGETEGCPPGLREQAEVYRTALRSEQEEIRSSSLASPRGVEETVQFDLGAHACHRGPGQAFRDYGEPECLAGEGESIPVRYPYALFFRKALTLEALFDKPWEPGSDGILRVTFEREEGSWIPVSRREVLDRKAAPRHGGG